MPNSNLFEPITLGKTVLKNHIVMSPLTRSRATGNIPNDLMAKYYAQRAGAGLIITEGTSPSPNGLGYCRIPGLYHVDQVRGWRKVTEAVHAANGKIFVQLMHTGRVGVTENLPEGARVLGPSAVATPGQMYTDQKGLVNYSVPQVMTESEIESTIEEYVKSAKLSIEAGFDGVELHGANGYLIDQFLNLESNQRKDQWGGSIGNRARFALEVAKRVAAAIGSDRVGIRLSPAGGANGMKADADTEELYAYLAEELSRLNLTYLHLVDHSAMGSPPVSTSLRQKLRKNFKGKMILAGGYDRARAETDLAEDKGDLFAFGRPFISNPGLVEKLKSGAELAAPDHTTFYTPGERGYTDYA